MNDEQKMIAQACLEGAETNTMTFPQIVGKLMDAGFESYAVDFRRATATYYLPDGASVELPTHRIGLPIAEAFDTGLVRKAISEAQRLVPGYTYKGFCNKAVAAGCVGYIVSFIGRRALYVGRTAETHVEHFPD
ncbi:MULTISPECIES: DUF1398 family protein [unclassified Chelatococcus]|jgi:uncharacterized protein YbcV (DUF1398 family)|uniref:DUF1398 domain-containing protein n=1 Tax=unclassified Chelatococcus TaxID=2638111 RepID=UPI001BCE20A6|nr:MULTISPECIES: DUF1398 family protein [unclassified Chelatococcus]CAH1658098.1 conserved hypothetical protein [Hyphomicrobiales bacterium]MBS7742218.1 DUF1398 family protein [Chelatococcus sp. HY11]MBX3542664.1 DUF1398 family protein [Chelatococcus sp.]MCO5075120.1 DUF1398 domain-containing protein [Chelatococcus sp.]CAH1689578.1 conserved hypothetical protein [Hyphomicrobiales bacterium]